MLSRLCLSCELHLAVCPSCWIRHDALRCPHWGGMGVGVEGLPSPDIGRKEPQVRSGRVPERKPAFR